MKITPSPFSMISIASLISVTLLSGAILSSSIASADDDTAVDNVSIVVPAACTMTGTGMNTHTANIANGTYQSNIGTTTLKAYCNDPEGFSIYAIGYTDNTDGKNVLTSSALGSDYDITTGTGTSGNSQWAMKLATITSPTPTYPITIQNSFDNYHIVPSDYTLVAKRTAGTDTGTNAEGSTLTTTYQAYISGTQPAGTYTGQVKYVMVHPNNTDEIPVREDQVAVVFDGNGLTFPGGLTKNRVVYGDVCTPMYIGTNPTIVKTSNVTDENTYTPYEPEEHILQEVPLTGADKVKVVVKYGLTNEAYITIAEGSWAGWDEEEPSGRYYNLNTWDSSETDYLISGTKTYIFDSDTVTIEMYGWDTPVTDYDFGMYVEVYPLYDTEQTGTEETLVCGFGVTSGSYVETTTWNNYWYIQGGDYDGITIESQQINDFVEYAYEYSKGTTIKLYSANSYTIVFNPNGGSGTINNQEIYPYSASTLNTNHFTHPTKEFISWNTKPDGTGESYQNKEQIETPINGAKGGETVTLYAQWGDCPANLICYKSNGDNVIGTMGKPTISSSATSATLLASNYSREGYGFAGWSDVPDCATNPNAHFYGPQEDITFTAGQYSSKGLMLYAIWIASEGSLQDSSKVASVCNRLTQSGPNVTRTINSVSALTDQRDGETYAIAKLADGNCWMIENLRLEAENTRGADKIALSQGYNTTNFTGLADREVTNFSNSTATNYKNTNIAYYGADNSDAEIIISASDHTSGSTDYSGYHFPRYNNYNNQTTSANRPQNPTTNSATNGTAGMYSYGNYYTWSAAMADTTFYRTTTADANGYTPSEASNHSLCPTGWRLPYGRSSGKGALAGGFSYLDTQLGGTGASSSSSTTPTGEVMSKAWRSYPNNFLYSGLFYMSSVNNRGSGGSYWSSTAGSNDSSYYVYLNSTLVYPGTYGLAKFNGYSIRCVASGS